MKINIIAVGKGRNSVENQLVGEYSKRLSWKFNLLEIEEKKAKTLLSSTPSKSYKIVLDEDGRQFTSREFAAHIQKLQTNGQSEISFLIGGADGHDEKTLAAADLKLSLGKMTLPHMLVRPVLAEQLYRAWSIISGHPYHRD